MNAKADETERRFLARHLGRVPDTLDPKTACDRDKQKPLD
jgi:hypothetical protein